MRRRTFHGLSTACLLVALMMNPLGAQERFFFRNVQGQGVTGNGNTNPGGGDVTNPGGGTNNGSPVQISLGGTLPTEAMVGIPILPVSVSASGGTAPLFLTLTGAPNGLDIGSTLFGTPLQAGLFDYTITATDSASTPGTASRTGSITVHQAFNVQLSGTFPGQMTVGDAAPAAALVASGGKTPYTFGSTAPLPGGLSLNTATGAITGELDTPGIFEFELTASQSFPGGTTFGSGLITVVVLPEPLSVSGNSFIAEYGIGTSFPQHASIVATGGVAPYTYTASGLPTGMGFSNGVTTGAPTEPNDYQVTLTAKDSSTPERTGTRTVSIAVYPQLTLALTKPAYLTAGVPVAGLTVTSQGGKGSVRTYTVASGALPNGVNLASDGTFSGSPIGSGLATFRLAVQDELGTTTVQTEDQTIGYAPAFSVVTGPLAAGKQNDPYDQLVVSGGRAPYTVSLSTGTLPAGLSFTQTTGRLTGFPEASGSYSLQITATDADGRPASRTVALSVDPGVTAASRSLIDQVTVTATGPTEASGWTLVGGSPAANFTGPATGTTALNIAKDANNYTTSQQGSAYHRGTGSLNTAAYGYQIVYRFSADVLASQADQVIGANNNTICTGVALNMTYEGSLNGSTWFTLIPTFDVRNAGGNGVTVAATNGGMGNNYAVYNVNRTFTPTTVRFVRVTTRYDRCSNGTTGYILRSGAVR